MRASILPCSSLAAWYPPFSLRSPSSRAASIFLAMSARAGPLSSSSSADSRSNASWVSQVVTTGSDMGVLLKSGRLLSLGQPAGADQPALGWRGGAEPFGEAPIALARGGQVHDLPPHDREVGAQSLEAAGDAGTGVH